MKQLLHVAESDESFTQGKAYDVEFESVNLFVVADDAGDVQAFTKVADREGLSYATWFTIIEVEDDAE